MKTGIATIKSFQGDPSGSTIGLSTPAEPAVRVPVDQAVTDRLIAEYGIPRGPDFTSLEGIIGASCIWEQNHLGVVIGLRILGN